MNKGPKRFYNKLKLKNYCPNHVCEVGVYLPQESNVIDFINEDIETTLIEADPEYVKNILSFFSNQKKVTVIEAAVFDFNGKIELSKKEASTFISQLASSPALMNDHFRVNDEDKFIANSIIFSDIDKGAFDLISIDIEGAEWYVIKHMISRPNIISIETHGKYYTNPNIGEIKNWMQSNNYTLWYKDKSDSVYIKKGTFKITPFEKIQLGLINFLIFILKKKKIFKKKSYK